MKIKEESVTANTSYIQDNIHKELSFIIKNHETSLIDISTLTKEELVKEIEKGYEDMVAGKTISAEQIRLELDAKYR